MATTPSLISNRGCFLGVLRSHWIELLLGVAALISPLGEYWRSNLQSVGFAPALAKPAAKRWGSVLPCGLGLKTVQGLNVIVAVYAACDGIWTGSGTPWA